jgi:hypothetical protein
MVGTRHGVANIFRRARTMLAPPNGRNGVMVSCYPRVNACKRRSRWHGACHVLLRNSVVADRMKFIDSLVANTTTSPQRDVGDGKGNSSDLGVAG